MTPVYEKALQRPALDLGQTAARTFALSFCPVLYLHMPGRYIETPIFPIRLDDVSEFDSYY
jgi:hypothetical protein